MKRLSCISLFSTGANLGSFCAKKHFWFTSLSKIQVARLVAFTAVDRFFEWFNGCRRNELRNAAGLILKLRKIVAVHDLKISFYMQILVPPHFWLVPPHFVCSGDGTGSNSGFKQLELLAYYGPAIRASERKFSRGYEGRYRAPKAYLASQALSGPMLLNHFLSEGCRSSFKCERITIYRIELGPLKNTRQKLV